MDQVEQIMKQLRTTGGAQADVDTDDEADQWRKDARAAARRLGRPVQTIQAGHIVAASLRDWPANELEEQKSQATRAKIYRKLTKIYESAAHEV